MTEEVKGLHKGATAPDFTLKDQNAKEFTLSAQKGKKVLLSFHPLAWTGVCAEQVQALEAHQDVFDSLDTVAVGISVDSGPSKEAWAKDFSATRTRLLADFWPHGGVAALYGVFRQQDGLAHRSNFIVDKDGTIAFAKIYDMGELPDIDEVIAELKKL